VNDVPRIETRNQLAGTLVVLGRFEERVLDPESSS
jgi:hypothetical protein